MISFSFTTTTRAIFVLLAAPTIFGCTKRGPSLAAGDCMSVVDAPHTWKVTRIEGKTSYVQQIGAGAPADAKEEPMSESRHYTKVPCP